MLIMPVEYELTVSGGVLHLQVALEGAVSKKAAMTSLAQGLQPQVLVQDGIWQHDMCASFCTLTSAMYTLTIE